MAKKRYVAIDTIDNRRKPDDEPIAAGSVVTMDTDQAKGLLACGALREFADADLTPAEREAKERAEQEAQGKAEAETRSKAKAKAEAKAKADAEERQRIEAGLNEEDRQRQQDAAAAGAGAAPGTGESRDLLSGNDNAQE